MLIEAAVGVGAAVLAVGVGKLREEMCIRDRTGFEPETLAFFLTTLGTAVCATGTPEDMFKQTIFIILGVALYFFLGAWLRSLERVKASRFLAAAAALGLLAVNVVFSEAVFGAKNWLSIAGVSFQPSELVKVLYIYTGAATLDRLFARRNLFVFIVFSAICVIALALIGCLLYTSRCV